MIDYEPQIRSLTWPDSVSPLDLPGFETQARRLRYQALGDACRQNMLDWLLLAHHSDDQAETVLMRLASGHRGYGLQGMPDKAPIPECWGMHGLRWSGGREISALKLSKWEKTNPADPATQKYRYKLTRPDIHEQGGIRIMRPLLNFSKKRLIETCRARGLAWEEDKTNEDVWRTPRNSIRALLRSDRLPQALLKGSMLQLSKQISNALHRQESTVKKIMNCCELLLFDARCGALVVRLPSRMLTNNFKHEDVWTRYKDRLRITAMLLLKRFASIVTPQEEVSLQSLEQAALSIFPDLNDRENLGDETLQPTTFTASNVQFQQLRFPLAAPRSKSDPAISGRWEDLDPLFVWKLTRQPFSKAPPSHMVQPSVNSGYPVTGNSPSWSSWQLWDGRYWIRLLNLSCLPLLVRSFQPSDLQHLHSALTRQRYKEFHTFLSLNVPGKLRWTLLAVAEVENDSLPMGRLLALPTLGKAGTFDIGDTNNMSKVEWQIRYKLVHLGYRLSEDGYSKIFRSKNLTTSWQD